EIEGLAPDTLDQLLGSEWPGNVRELRAAVRQSVLNTTGTVILPESLPAELRGETEGVPTESTGAAKAANGKGLSSDLAKIVEPSLAAGETDLYAKTLEAMERYVITRVLQETEGNQSQAAEILGITRGKIRDRISTFRISLGTNVGIEDQSTG
ncbi:MAG: sigma-54-dependent Fis family transcriptional regulator, partial [Planctomycetaceae bacterium]|nr:sigma-54-dependent Fis family transcriptional regulator [Planctomycetaceae bacterium]